MFDFDSTLVESLKYWYKTEYDLAFKHFNIKPKQNYQKKVEGFGTDNVAKCFVKLTNLKKTPKEVVEVWQNYMKDFYTKKVKLVKGVKKFLSYLKQKGYKLAIASATEENLLKLAMNRHNLVPYFDNIISEKTIKTTKLEPKFMDKVEQILNVKRDEILFFEDSFQSLQTSTSGHVDCVGRLNKYNAGYKKEMQKICVLTIKNYNDKKLYKML